MGLYKIWTIGSSSEIETAAAAFEQEIAADPFPEHLSLAMFEDKGTSWRLDVYYDHPNDIADFAKRLTAFDASLANLKLIEEEVIEENWVAKSLEGLAPIRAGKFFVYGAHDADKVPPGVIPLLIEAGEAFGTGHHGTTEGCLTALSQIAEHETPDRVLDLGTGTGVLAIGAAKLWRVPIMATDIDPIAVKVAHENAILNGAHQKIRMVVASGTNHAAIHEMGPYDLICANILARPLRQLAGDIASILAPGGVLVLSGILTEQAARVVATYRGHHVISQTRLDLGEWVTLVLRKS